MDFFTAGGGYQRRYCGTVHQSMEQQMLWHCISFTELEHGFYELQGDLKRLCGCFSSIFSVFRISISSFISRTKLCCCWDRGRPWGEIAGCCGCTSLLFYHPSSSASLFSCFSLDKVAKTVLRSLVIRRAGGWSNGEDKSIPFHLT